MPHKASSPSLCARVSSWVDLEHPEIAACSAAASQAHPFIRGRQQESLSFSVLKLNLPVLPLKISLIFLQPVSLDRPQERTPGRWMLIENIQLAKFKGCSPGCSRSMLRGLVTLPHLHLLIALPHIYCCPLQLLQAYPALVII